MASLVVAGTTAHIAATAGEEGVYFTYCPWSFNRNATVPVQGVFAASKSNALASVMNTIVAPAPPENALLKIDVWLNTSKDATVTVAPAPRATHATVGSSLMVEALLASAK